MIVQAAGWVFSFRAEPMLGCNTDNALRRAILITETNLVVLFLRKFSNLAT